MNQGLAGWYRGRRVLVTGHTGFKGAWLTTWLRAMGADVTGFALPPPPEGPSLFVAAGVEDSIRSVIGDVRDRTACAAVLDEAQPELVFHLAAQSLVRMSYRDPVGTFETNVVGTAILLDLLRERPGVGAAVIVTSDKCYDNREFDHAYSEDEPLGGYDPYSASKACAELVTSAMRRSFFFDGSTAIGSARAGNVIGGGDWAADRLVPDIMRMAARGGTAPLRNPASVRPWQLVLEPLRGYLMLGRALVERGAEFAEAWNFGPAERDCVTVADVVTMMQHAWDRAVVRAQPDPLAPHEAALLKLDWSKAEERLGWRPAIDLATAVDMTVSWYRRYYERPAAARELVEEQLAQYERLCATREST